MREICLDTETTGLTPKEGHKIIEIACVELVNKIKTGEHFHIYVNPRRDVPEEAFKIHGISTEFLQDKPIFDHIAQKFLDFIQNDTLIIHNAAFDLKFLNFELGVIGLPTLKNNIIDSLKLARQKFPGSPNSLDALCKRFNIDLSVREKHGALTDTQLLCDVYVELTGGLQSGLNLESKSTTKNFNTNPDKKELKIIKKRSIPKRSFPPSKAELSKHKEFIETYLPDSTWYNS